MSEEERADASTVDPDGIIQVHRRCFVYRLEGSNFERMQELEEEIERTSV
jgi:hypothetical protein